MADTAATLSLAVKLSDQLTAELKKVADTTRRETDRAAKSVAGLGESFGAVRTNLKSTVALLRDLGTGFGIGFGVIELVNGFGQLTRELNEARRAYEVFGFAQRNVGRESVAGIARLKQQAEALRGLYSTDLFGGGTFSPSNFADAANQGRSFGLSIDEIERARELAAELASKTGLDLKTAMGAVSQALVGTEDGFRLLGEAMSADIRTAEQAEVAFRRLALEAERTRLIAERRDASRSLVGNGNFAPQDLRRVERLEALNAEIRKLEDTLRSGELLLDPVRTAAELQLERFIEEANRFVARMDTLGDEAKKSNPARQLSDDLKQLQIDFERRSSEIARLSADLQRKILAGDPNDVRRLRLAADVSAAALQAQADLRTTTDARGNVLTQSDGERAKREAAAEHERYMREPAYADRGVQRALEDIRAEYNDLNQRAYDSVRNFARSLEDNFATAFENIIDGTESVGDALKNILRGVVSDLIKDTSRQLAKTLVGAIFGAGDRGMTTDGAGFSGSSLMSSARFLSAYSNAPMRALADGGVLNRPTLAVAGENGPEAFVPLRGGKIPVSVNGGGGSTVVNLTLNVSSWDGQDAARSVQKAMPQIVAGVQKAIATDRSMRSAIKSA